MNIKEGVKYVGEDEKRSFWTRLMSGVSSAFVPLSVLATAALYFTGSSYLSAKAKGLGLAAAPSSIAFQETMAVGGSILATFEGVWRLLLSLFILLFGHEAASRFLRRLISIPEKLDEWPRESWLELARGAFHAIPLFVVPFIIIDFGRSEGSAEAQRIRTTVSGGCETCSVFSQTDLTATGVVAFNDQQGLIVAHKDGLAIFPYGKSIMMRTVASMPKATPKRVSSPKPDAKNQTTTGD